MFHIVFNNFPAGLGTAFLSVDQAHRLIIAILVNLDFHNY